MFQNSCESLRGHNRVSNFTKVLKNGAAGINQMVWTDELQTKLSYQKGEWAGKYLLEIISGFVNSEDKPTCNLGTEGNFLSVCPLMQALIVQMTGQ